MQNFYDGHGQTLNGVKFKVTPDENGKYNVRIEGKSIYSPEKAILLGETTKKKNSEAAGNYGEGLKMVVLKLLKEKGVDEVNIASDNWKTNWQMQNGTFGTDVLTFELDKVKPIDGNYIEFKTDDVNFIKTIIKTFDRFYHSGNPSFHSPDFENDTLGINFRNDDDKGKFYIAGQTFEVNGEYEGLGNMNFYIKKKPPVKYNNKIIFDPSRDRTSLNSENLEALGLWVVNSNNMSQEEAVKLLSSLREYWDAGVPFTKNGKYKDVPGASFISGMLNGLASRGDLYSRITFPDNKDIGYNYATPEMIQSYMDKGYRFCNDSLSYLGMKSFNQVLKEARCHSAIEPNQQEKNRILILQDAIKLFEPYLLKNNLFNEKELCPNVYIFDKNSPKENKTYETALAEAIVQDGQSKGFWIDKSYLSSSSFSSVLGTALHELTHKYGGDESMEFSYKLTDVMKNMIATINADPKLGYQLKLLEQAWEKQ